MIIDNLCAMRLPAKKTAGKPSTKGVPRRLAEEMGDMNVEVRHTLGESALDGARKNAAHFIDGAFAQQRPARAGKTARRAI